MEEQGICGFLDGLDPEVGKKLMRTEVYRRFVHERARLERMVTKEYKRSGRLTDPGILALSGEVERLGQSVLEEIANIRAMLCEPSFEEFRAMRKETE